MPLLDRNGYPIVGGQGPAIVHPTSPQVDLAVGMADGHVVVMILVGGKVAGAIPLTADQARHHIAGVEQVIATLEGQCPPASPSTDPTDPTSPDMQNTIGPGETESPDSSICPGHGVDAGQHTS